MPRETVHTGELFQPVVGWQKDHGNVQIGVVMRPQDASDPQNLFEQLWGSMSIEQTIQLGKVLRAELGVLTEESDYGLGFAVLATFPNVAMGYDSLWADLDSRSAINELIRKLRHARDSAFGKDE